MEDKYKSARLRSTEMTDLRDYQMTDENIKEAKKVCKIPSDKKVERIYLKTSIFTNFFENVIIVYTSDEKKYIASIGKIDSKMSAEEKENREKAKHLLSMLISNRTNLSVRKKEA